MPNSFVDVMSRQLGRKGLVKEIAADIFMGQFVKTFGAQAKKRESVLGEDTPYGAYYSVSILGFPKGSENKTVHAKDLISSVKLIVYNLCNVPFTLYHIVVGCSSE